MKLKKVRINKFRLLEDIEIKIGDKITAIAGQNGTAKSSILGLIGHVFVYDNKYRTINGKPFSTKFSEIFRFSYPTYDKPKEHDYSVVLENGQVIPVLSYDRVESGKPNELRLRVGKSEKDAGKFEHPVIYLGLKRLIPLAQDSRVKLYKKSELTDNEIDKYNKYHNEILLLNDKITPEKVETRTKTFYGAKTAIYDSWGNSAGQDNIGQLLTALFSFERLKNSRSEQYNGGLILIDEIDVTLYAAAQEKLIEKLFRIASDLELQIIFTTHSLTTLRFLSQEKYKQHSELVYLSKARGMVEVYHDIDMVRIESDLSVLAPLLGYTARIHVYCEDREARYFLMKLLGIEARRKIEVIPKSLGASMLVELANQRVPEFMRSIIVLDGDQAKNLRKPKPPNVVILPGNERPENVFHRFLGNLSPGDRFWGGVGEYTQQVCFRNCAEIGDRNVMKKWFNDQLPNWGKAASRMINRWKEDNQKAVEDFAKDFQAVYDKVEKLR